jgi:hypothetical protein
MTFFNFISEVIEPITKLIDETVTTDEERLSLKKQIIEVESKAQSKILELQAKILDLESKCLEAKSNIITAEAKGENFAQRNWRPGIMMLFGGLLFIYYAGLAPDYVAQNPDVIQSLQNMIMIGIGGYIGGRSYEKVTKIKNK